MKTALVSIIIILVTTVGLIYWPLPEPDRVFEKIWFVETEGESKEMLSLFDKKSEQSEAKLQKLWKGFKTLQSDLQKDIQRQRLQSKTNRAMYYGDWVYNFYRDDKNPKGVYRRVARGVYLQNKSHLAGLAWETVLDIDEVIKEKKFPKEITDPSTQLYKWSCYHDKKTNEQKRCLVGFSQSGGDQRVFYEYDIKNKKWVKEGFNFEVFGRSSISWLSEDEVAVNLDWVSYYKVAFPDKKEVTREEIIEMGLMAKDGGANKTYLWKRGKAFSAEQPIFDGVKDAKSNKSIWFTLAKSLDPEWKENQFLVFAEYLSRNHYKYYIKYDFNGEEKYLTKLINLPELASLLGMSDGQELLFEINEDWKGFLSGDIISIQIQKLESELKLDSPTLVYRNTDSEKRVNRKILVNYNPNESADDVIFLSLSKNASQSLAGIKKVMGRWGPALPIEPPLDIRYQSTYLKSDGVGSDVRVFVSGFLTPWAEYFIYPDEEKGFRFKKGYQQIQMFDADKFEVHQFWVERKEEGSDDVVRVPYYVVAKGNIDRDVVKEKPTLLYGYGGFSVSLHPRYLTYLGKYWLEQGGVYVLANIRGGKEFGVPWHKAVLKSNRNKAFEDFIAVAEDLIQRGITSSEKLAIEGASNGGLLVGAAMTMRPDLFKAVVCRVPVLDMFRYHKLLVGKYWLEEYGDPEGDEMYFWKKYSPLHQLKKEVQYPRIFLMTNRFDDRVHPAHARKFSLRLDELGKKHFYYEDRRGGHGGTARTSEEEAYRRALYYAYLYSELM